MISASSCVSLSKLSGVSLFSILIAGEERFNGSVNNRQGGGGGGGGGARNKTARINPSPVRKK